MNAAPLAVTVLLNMPPPLNVGDCAKVPSVTRLAQPVLPMPLILTQSREDVLAVGVIWLLANSPGLPLMTLSGVVLLNVDIGGSRLISSAASRNH